jgi:membrane protein DedA with SNARE-associated domain
MHRLLTDTLIVVISIVCAVYIAQTGAIHVLVSATSGNLVVAAFVAGLFFTSLFTTAPAMVVLGELAQQGSLPVIALAGAAGAMLGDYILFLFVRGRIAVDAQLLAKGPRLKFVVRALKHSRLRFVLPVIGALIIASPLPDELGMLLLGISSVKSRTFLLVSFFMNLLGIVLIGLAARALV